MNLEKVDSSTTTKVISGFLIFMIMFAVQLVAGKAGWAVADLFSYDTIDPNNLFARLSVHHLVLIMVALAIILIVNKATQVDFGFHLGERGTGRRYLLIFTLVIGLIALAYHVLMQAFGQPVTYNYPLTTQNMLGYLAFQLLLSGPAEEILYRALPVTLFASIFGKKPGEVKDVTLEVVLAAALFTAAHVQWTLSPFSISEFNIFGLVYAFGMGILNGFVYQKSRSIVYPILMHSLSNVLMVGTGYAFAALF